MIKFRVFDKIYGRYLSPVKRENMLWNALNKTAYLFTNKYYILEICTGLTDKNGKDIYVGDIVKFEDTVSDYDYLGEDASYDVEQLAQVEWNKFKGVILTNFKIGETDLSNEFNEIWNDLDLEAFWKLVEVIGNINENKEMLENE